ncbi:aldo/keto reductase [Streptomyces sp. SID4928]|uniref:aldo/keto reductase n=1 Tax=Streptomyces TaxID=1883 RepID=UPI0001C1A649|nr:aldo/keto reductase [Streptomyces sp. ACT-1]EGE39556.1 NADP-dependent oxidoreductase domain protein [Streptomyces sp. ACT-1]MYR47647.1 aldo/keto reductase [Streptomyces sp. SID4928]
MTAHDLGPRYLCRGISTRPLGLHCDVPTDQLLPDAARRNAQFLDGLTRAVQHGATFFDTADSYGQGHSERALGHLAAQYPDAALQLSSKVGQIRGSAEHPYAGRHIHHQLEQSLENLYAEELHLYTLDSFDFGPGDRYLGNAIDAMRTLRDVKAIRAIGMRGPFTNYAAPPEEWAAAAERFLHLFRLIKPDVVWTRFNAFTPAVLVEGQDLFTFAARHGVGLVLSAPLAHGVLVGRETGSSSPHAQASPRQTGLAPSLRAQLAEQLHYLRHHFGDRPGTLARLALRSSLQRSDQCVVVAGFSTAAQVEENFSCLGKPLTETELRIVDDVYAGLRAQVQEAGARRPVKQLQS